MRSAPTVATLLTEIAMTAALGPNMIIAHMVPIALTAVTEAAVAAPVAVSVQAAVHPRVGLPHPLVRLSRRRHPLPQQRPALLLRPRHQAAFCRARLALPLHPPHLRALQDARPLLRRPHAPVLRCLLPVPLKVTTAAQLNKNAARSVDLAVVAPESILGVC